MGNPRKVPNGHASSVIGLLGAEIPSRPSAPLRGATLLSLWCSLAFSIPLGTGSSVPAKACLLWLWCHPCPALRHHSWVSFILCYSGMSSQLSLWPSFPQVLHTASSKIHIQPRTARAKKNFNKNKQFRRSGGQAGGRADHVDSVLFLAGEAQEVLLGTSSPKTNTARQASFVFLPLMVEHPG